MLDKRTLLLGFPWIEDPELFFTGAIINDINMSDTRILITLVRWQTSILGHQWAKHSWLFSTDHQWYRMRS